MLVRDSYFSQIAINFIFFEILNAFFDWVKIRYKPYVLKSERLISLSLLVIILRMVFLLRILY